MIQISKKGINQCIDIFTKMKKQKEIPLKMQLKLDLLLSCIQNNQINDNNYDQLAHYEKMSLTQMNIENKIELFCNIVNCLSGNELILYFQDQKSYIRKQQLFSMWSQCYITIDSNSIIIKKKPNKQSYIQILLENLKISKQFRQYKNKSVFGIIHNNKKYLIGFNTQNLCQTLHSTLTQITKEKKNNLKNKMQQQINLQKSKIQQSQPTVTTQQLKETQEEQQYNNFQYNQELNILIQQLHNTQFNNNEGYILFNNFQSGRILINTQNKNQMKIILLLQTLKPQGIFQSYIEFNQWNPQIQQCQIKTKINQNSYLIYFKIKKYSMMSYQRDALVVATAIKKDNKYYLSLRSV